MGSLFDNREQFMLIEHTGSNQVEQIQKNGKYDEQ